MVHQPRRLNIKYRTNNRIPITNNLIRNPHARHRAFEILFDYTYLGLVNRHFNRSFINPKLYRDNDATILWL